MLISHSKLIIKCFTIRLIFCLSLYILLFDGYEKILMRFEIILIEKYDRDEAAIEDNIAASKGLNSIINNSYSIIHLDKLLTISNIDHANIIFFIICFKILKLISLVSLLVYFCLLSIWKRTTKVVL